MVSGSDDPQHKSDVNGGRYCCWCSHFHQHRLLTEANSECGKASVPANGGRRQWAIAGGRLMPAVSSFRHWPFCSLENCLYTYIYFPREIYTDRRSFFLPCCFELFTCCGWRKSRGLSSGVQTDISGMHRRWADWSTSCSCRRRRWPTANPLPTNKKTNAQLQAKRHFLL